LVYYLVGYQILNNEGHFKYEMAFIFRPYFICKFVLTKK
jgi:hypothetical protein